MSKIDSKGRVSIPIGLRARLKLLEGSRVKFLLKNNELVLVPVNGQSGVKASIDSESVKACGASGSGSNPDSGPKKNKKNILRIGVPSKGWLSSPCFELLKKSGFELNGTKRKYSKNSNDGVEFILTRAKDIPKYVECEALDAGITGYDLVLESGLDILDILDLKFGYCRVIVAVEESLGIDSVEEMKENTRIATEFPNITKKFFDKLGKKVKPIKVDGAVEITPYIGIADGIVDLTTTGRTLRENGLKEIGTIVDSSARLVVNKDIFRVKKNEITEFVRKIENVVNGK